MLNVILLYPHKTNHCLKRINDFTIYIIHDIFTQLWNFSLRSQPGEVLLLHMYKANIYVRACVCVSNPDSMLLCDLESISRFARASSHVADFNTRNELLTQKLLINKAIGNINFAKIF